MNKAPRRIFLTKGLSTLVDFDTYDWAIKRSWYAHKSRSNFYARSWSKSGGEYLHRLILKTRLLVDHVNQDPLDNRRSNLRPATRGENASNVKRTPGESGFFGVRGWGDKWQARITVDGRRQYLGTFTTAEEAALAYDDAGREAKGAFALLNFPHLAKSLVG